MATEDIVIIVAVTVLVSLFTGPGLWSNDSELPVVHLWRWLKGLARPPKQP